MAGQQLEQQIMQRMNEIERESSKDPSQAISDALMLPLQGTFPPSSPRASSQHCREGSEEETGAGKICP
jgi:hypothetical protein